ncbi:toxin-antitoxin system HicB family antitoxin [Enterobacter quasimori]|uniref:Toxin-antitoxin system HicB family antitoxin n=1 Tax=Enterobacter quasimori TaxID=2838947 RepID=A0ABY0AMH2_9ENTR|nr:toxin-antitoxin system HicB family antitoxin [Enterobacter quasimori]
MYVKYNNIVASFLTSNLKKKENAVSDERLYIRVSTELRSRLQVAAASAGLSLNQYVNSLLESGGSQDEFKTMVIELLHDISEMVSNNENNNRDTTNLETLMYLRLLSTPEHRKKVNAELNRLGLKPARIDNE